MSPAPVGHVRIFEGAPLSRLVTVSLAVPPIGLDSHMIFAFTGDESWVPHFTLDSVKAGPHFAFHLDLIPRADLAANLDYLNEVFEPLSATHSDAVQIAGLSPAHLSRRQWALMSPWMLAFRADEASFASIGAPVDRYLDHWFAVLERGVATTDIAGGSPAERDRRNRAALFNPEVDPVWNQVERLLGPDVGARIRDLLKGGAL